MSLTTQSIVSTKKQEPPLYAMVDGYEKHDPPRYAKVDGPEENLPKDDQEIFKDPISIKIEDILNIFKSSTPVIGLSNVLNNSNLTQYGILGLLKDLGITSNGLSYIA